MWFGYQRAEGVVQTSPELSSTGTGFSGNSPSTCQGKVLLQSTFSWGGCSARPGFLAVSVLKPKGWEEQLHPPLTLLAMMTSHHKQITRIFLWLGWMPQAPGGGEGSDGPWARGGSGGRPHSRTLHLRRFPCPPRAALPEAWQAAELACRQFSIQRHFLTSRSVSRISSLLRVHENRFWVAQHMKQRRKEQRGKRVVCLKRSPHCLLFTVLVSLRVSCNQVSGKTSSLIVGFGCYRFKQTNQKKPALKLY